MLLLHALKQGLLSAAVARRAYHTRMRPHDVAACCAHLLQELRVFLETAGELGSNMRWTGMMPASASVLEGTAKFSMQLIGRESKVSCPGKLASGVCSSPPFVACWLCVLAPKGDVLSLLR